MSGRPESPNSMNHQAEDTSSARLAIMELANMISVPMSLNAIVHLNVPNLMFQSGSNTPLSAQEIAGLIPVSPPADPSNLGRLLRMLTSYGVFTEQIIGSDRKYSLTDIGKTLVDDSNGFSFGPYVLQHHQDALLRSWPLLQSAVLDSSTEPFSVANGGVSAYDYYGDKPEMNDLMQKAMSGVSIPFIDLMINHYHNGFHGIERLVDVGGSSGYCLKMIMQSNPQIKVGINFDLPEVVAKAPFVSGVIHMGGDMFKSVPSGDAIFMKWILTTWTDEECQLILKNCYNALEKGGKVIVCEPVLPEETDNSRRTRALLEGDIFVMAIYRAKGKERTEDEFRQLGTSVGFSKFRAIYFDHFYTLMEFHK